MKLCNLIIFFMLIMVGTQETVNMQLQRINKKYWKTRSMILI